MKIAPALTFAALICGASAFAGIIPGSFRQVDCEGGGWFEQIIPHRSGVLYGRTDVGGMYRSDDHGDTWQFLSGDLQHGASYHVQGVAVSAFNPDVVYQATGVSYSPTDPGRGVWKSSDGGGTWTQVLAGVNFSGNDLERWGTECLVIAPDNDNELWAGSRQQGLWRSINAGAGWTNVAPADFDTPNIIIASIAIHPSAPNTIWVAGSVESGPNPNSGGVWVSTNRGVTWTKKINATRIYSVALKEEGGIITAFAAGVDDPEDDYSTVDVLWRMTAFGTATNVYSNFNAVLPYQPFAGDELAMVQVLGNGHVWASNLFEFTARSLDNGNSFELMPMTLTGPLPSWSRDINAIEGGRNGLIQDPTNANRLFLGGGYAPFRSVDGGATWSFMTKGIGETVAWRPSYHPTDPNRIWFPLADLGATTVSDAGASGISTGYIAPHFPFPDDIVMFARRLLISPGKVIAPGGEQSGHQPRIYQTTNEGATWTKLAGTGLPFASGREIIETVASKDNGNDFLIFTGGPLTATAGGVYRTTDGGGNFSRSSGFPTGYDPGQEFYWNVSLERDATDNAVRYALLRNSGFWKSSDRGASWTKPGVQPNGSFGRLRVDAVSGRLWVGHSFGLEYSATGGNSWVFLNGVFETVTELDVHDGRIAVIGRKSGDTSDHIYYSSDNGASWNEITRPGARFAKTEQVSVDPWRPGTVWICTGGRAIARFTPGSGTPVETWRETNFGTRLPNGPAAPQADPERDGLVNQLEYVTGTNPNTLTPARPWQPSRAGGRLTFTFSRNTAATDAIITVQGADNVDGPWTDLARSAGGAATAPLIGGVSVMESGSGAIRTVEVRDLFMTSDAAHPKRFMRLHVVVP